MFGDRFRNQISHPPTPLASATANRVGHNNAPALGINQRTLRYPRSPRNHKNCRGRHILWIATYLAASMTTAAARDTQTARPSRHNSSSSSSRTYNRSIAGLAVSAAERDEIDASVYCIEVEKKGRSAQMRRRPSWCSQGGERRKWRLWIERPRRRRPSFDRGPGARFLRPSLFFWTSRNARPAAPGGSGRLRTPDRPWPGKESREANRSPRRRTRRASDSRTGVALPALRARNG